MHKQNLNCRNSKHRLQDKCFEHSSIWCVDTWEVGCDGESLVDVVKHANTKTPDVVYICA